MIPKRFDSFDDACCEAKERAYETKESIFIRKCGCQWEISLNNNPSEVYCVEGSRPRIMTAGVNLGFDEGRIEKTDRDFEEVEYRKEIASYQDDLARSSREGWFHPNTDGSWEDNLSDEK